MSKNADKKIVVLAENVHLGGTEATYKKDSVYTVKEVDPKDKKKLVDVKMTRAKAGDPVIGDVLYKGDQVTVDAEIAKLLEDNGQASIV